MEFDIRTNQAEEISVLRFADDSDCHVASGILRNWYGGGGVFR